MGTRFPLEAVAGLCAFLGIISLFAASQLFWLRRIKCLAQSLLPSRPWREWLGGAAVVLYLLVFAYNLAWAHLGGDDTRLTWSAAILDAPFKVWLLGSVLGFFLACLFWVGDRVVRGAYRALRKILAPSPPAEPASLSRRKFLEQSAIVACSAPFIASAYGVLYGRTNLEIANRRIQLSRLPRAFEGFRIAQLSDIHIGPFMPADDIRRYVALTNGLKADLIVLTGDFVTWDPGTQGAVVDALTGLKAPFGIYGCLGNHELWTDTEASITALFAERQIRILRQARAEIGRGGERLNLIGVDFQSQRGMGPYAAGLVRNYLRGVEPLVAPDTVNILLSHNPNTFDRAAELGIDLSLAGHTHGGQV
ncbi:MAG: hypothetical protein DMG21_05245, partial [Acidobacteria bacterium]